MEETITYVGLDVHKKSISVAVAEGGRRGEGRFFGTIPNKAAALTKLAETLSPSEGTGPRLRGGGALADPAPCRRSGQDRPARRARRHAGRRYAVTAPSL